MAKHVELPRLKKSARWMDIQEVVTDLERRGHFKNLDHAQAVDDFKKRYARGFIKKAKDDSGFPLFANIVIEDDKGRKRHVYKEETLFTLSDYRQVVRYHTQQGQHHMRFANTYARRCKQRTGKQLPLPFPGMPEPA